MGRGRVTALGTSFVGPRSVRPLPNALCRVQFYVPIGDIWPEETPPQTQPDPVSVFLEGIKLVPISLLQNMSVSRGRVCGDIFPRVPAEASLTSGGELFLGIRNLGASCSLCLPLGVSGDMVSHRGPWEHVSLPYAGSLGSLFASQGSWEYLRQVSLGLSFQARAVSDAPWKRCL